MFVSQASNTKVILLCGGEGSLKSISHLLHEVHEHIPATLIFLSEFSETMLHIFFSKFKRLSGLPIKLLTDEYEVLEPGTLYVASHSRTADFEAYQGYVAFRPIPFEYEISLDDHYSKLASLCGKSLVAIMLSGRGNEGVDGFGKIIECGGLTLSQLPQESVCHEKPFIALFQNKSKGAISASDLVYYLNDPTKEPTINYEKSTYL